MSDLTFELPPAGRTVLSGFESTYLPAYRTDSLELTGHAVRWREDLDAVLAAGVRHLRYPLRWQRIHTGPGQFDWTETDEVLGYLHERGATPIVDLVHHTTYPDWLSDGFRGRDFGSALVEYAEAVARRYPWLRAYTLFNEPFATLFLAGHEALWPPYDRGLPGLVRLTQSVLPALSRAAQCWAEVLPEAAHVWVDTAENHAGVPATQHYVALANDRRHLLLDLALGHDLSLDGDPDRPFLRRFVEAGGESLLDLTPIRVDVLGLDYYSHSEWFYDERGAYAPSPSPAGFAAVAEHYARRYERPLMLTETNLRGYPSDRASWLRYMVEQYDLALQRGVPLHGFCWFPQVDSVDWDSLLARGAGRTDPVGVVSRIADGERVETVFTDAWRQVVAGAAVDELPAYRFQSPSDSQLSGYIAQLGHWPWESPPTTSRTPAVNVPSPVTPALTRPRSLDAKTTGTAATPGTSGAPRTPATSGTPATTVRAGTAHPAVPDLVVLSHLRWTGAWQRPHHLVSRLARARAEAGARTFFVEEPLWTDVQDPELRSEDHDGVTRIWLAVPEADGDGEDLGFDHPAAGDYGYRLAEELAAQGRPPGPDVWVYTPMALDLAQSIAGGRLIYDVMDDLSSFLKAPPGLRLRQRRLLRDADVVFTGGPSLHRSILEQRRRAVHLFRSGVESAHYAAARTLRTAHERNVAGYVGVIDERLDLDLVGGLAAALPDWTVRIVGPVTKIDPADLPQESNLEYPGMAAYADLPDVMAGFDVALMPFALNAATRSISPTKTLEYLAAGLPVVSTAVPDVVADYAEVVHLADDACSFAAACREVITHPQDERDRQARAMQARQEWDYIAAEMTGWLDRHTATTVADADQDGATA